jgi:hypothetical protein
MTGSGGYPVRRAFSIPSLASRNTGSSGPSAQLRIRPDDDEHGHSRDSMRPSFANSFAPKRRGRREDRVRAAPAVSCANMHIENAHEHTGSAEAVRPSLRNGFTAYFVLSPARPGLLVTVARVMRSIITSLTPATGASGPHDFAVRERLRSSFANSASTASHRAFRDVRNALSSGGTARNTHLIWVKNKAEYFSQRGWT